MTRRGILKLIGFGFLGTLGYSFLRAIMHLSSRPPKRVYLPSSEIEKIKTKLLLGEDFILVKEGEAFLGFSRKCPHLGCKLNFDPQRNLILCPCHGSRFTPQGKYLAGPAKKNLKPLQLSLSERGVTIEITN